MIDPQGTDNLMCKLGSDKVVRLPRMPASAANIEKKMQWLPKLRLNLPITVSVVLGKGIPQADYPFSWLICQWLEGKSPSRDDTIDPYQSAIDLGKFVIAMKQIDSTMGPKCKHGEPLSFFDKEAITLSIVD